MRTSIRRGPLFIMGAPAVFLRVLYLAALSITSGFAQEYPEPIGDPAWSGSVSVRAQSRLAQYGLDAAPERVTLVSGGSISHVSGFSFGLSAAAQPGPWTIQRFTASSAYEQTLADVWTVELSIDRNWYPAGSVNPLAESPTSVSVTAGYDGDLWSFGAGFDRYLGGEGASFVSVDVSVYLPMDGFNILPLATASFGSQTVAATLLKRGRSKMGTGNASITTVTGLSSLDLFALIQIPLSSGWSCSAMPGVSYTPSDLAAATTRFTWSLGIRKSL